MPNIKQTITTHNNKILEKQKQQNKNPRKKLQLQRKRKLSTKRMLPGEQSNIPSKVHWPE